MDTKIKSKKNILTIAIAVIFVLFIGYGIEVFLLDINQEDYCPKNLYEIQNKTECLEAGGKWQQHPEDVEAPQLRAVVKGFCYEPQECYENYDQACSQQNRTVFIAATIIGLLAITVGLILSKEIAGTGILSGGLLVILYGTIRYWRHANNILKFVLLGVVLAVLIWIACKKIKKK